MTCALTISPHKFSGVEEYDYSTSTFFFLLAPAQMRGKERREAMVTAVVIGEITTMKATGTF